MRGELRRPRIRERERQHRRGGKRTIGDAKKPESESPHAKNLSPRELPARQATSALSPWRKASRSRAHRCRPRAGDFTKHLFEHAISHDQIFAALRLTPPAQPERRAAVAANCEHEDVGVGILL